jgi:hypothetical protein
VFGSKPIVAYSRLLQVLVDVLVRFPAPETVSAEAVSALALSVEVAGVLPFVP